MTCVRTFAKKERQSKRSSDLPLGPALVSHPLGITPVLDMPSLAALNGVCSFGLLMHVALVMMISTASSLPWQVNIAGIYSASRKG